MLEPRQHRHDVAPALAFNHALLAGQGPINMINQVRWGVAMYRIVESFTWVYRGVWFGSIRFALFLAVVLSWIGRCLDSWVLLGLFCLLRVTQKGTHMHRHLMPARGPANPQGHPPPLLLLQGAPPAEPAYPLCLRRGIFIPERSRLSAARSTDACLFGGHVHSW